MVFPPAQPRRSGPAHATAQFDTKQREGVYALVERSSSFSFRSRWVVGGGRQNGIELPENRARATGIRERGSTISWRKCVFCERFIPRQLVESASHSLMSSGAGWPSRERH